MKENITIASAKADDDFSKIIKLIYLTDDYIYPVMCDNDYAYFADIMGKFIKDDSLFSYRNIDVAKMNGDIAGIVLTLDSKTSLPKLDGIETRDCLLRVMSEYFEPLVNEIEPNAVYINNMCVFNEYRRKGIAQALIQHVFSKSCGKKVVLDCLEDNIPAVTFYKKNFEVTDRFQGFSGDKARLLPCLRFEATSNHNGDKVIETFQGTDCCQMTLILRS